MRAYGVMGLGASGKATVRALVAQGARVYLWDDAWDGAPDKAQAVHRELAPAPAGALHASPPADWPWAELTALVLAPGVPLTHPTPHPSVMLAQRAGVPVLGDVELLWQAAPQARYVGITGTNGKSTTTALIGHILHQAGLVPKVGGNLGTPALELLPAQHPNDATYVLELSSYQLDLLDRAHLDVAVWLNITPDHLDRHGGLRGYVAAKERIFRHARPGDLAIIGVDDAESRAVAQAVRAVGTRTVVTLAAFSTEHMDTADICVRDGILLDRRDGTRLPLHAMPALPGQHNGQNAAAAYAACRALGVDVATIAAAMASFPGLPHRLERVAEADGVCFINDSKATNADATAHALAPYGRIYWIAGGKPKEGGIASLHPYFPQVAHAFLIGAAEDAFAATLEGQVPYTHCGTLDAATRAAAAMAWTDAAAAADHAQTRTVLLSPACASFDQWPNFEARGAAFRQLAQALVQARHSGTAPGRPREHAA